MIIKDKEIVTLFYILYQRYFSNKDISIENVNIIIGDEIKVYIELLYNNIQTSINVITSIEVHKDYLLFKPKGVIRYGFLPFEVLSLLKEYLHKLPFIHILNDEVYIKNLYIKDLTYGQGIIEVSLK